MLRLALLALCVSPVLAQVAPTPPPVSADPPLRDVRTLMCDRGQELYHDDFDAHSPPAWGGWSAGEWTTMMMELCGTEMVVTVDESILLYGSAEGIDCNKDSIVLTASPSANKYASFAHARLWRADLKPGWAQKREQVKRLLAQRSEATPAAVGLLLQDEPGRSPPFFAAPAAVPKVARIEAQIAAGGVVPGCKALERLTSDKDAATAAAATGSLAVVAAWKQAMDAAIARALAAGDTFGAAETAAAMGKLHPGDPGKPYRDLAAELKKEPAYTAGKEYQKLAGAPFAARAAPAFATLVEAFVKKYPDGYYAALAPRLIIK